MKIPSLPIAAKSGADPDLGLRSPLVRKQTTGIDKLTVEEWSHAFHELELTQYHEAGHAVAFYLCGFRPKLIMGASIAHDRRTTAFFRTRGGFLETPLARQRAQNYAVCCIAGIAAESKFARVPLADLRRLSGKDDYEAVHAIGHRLAICGGIESCPEVTAAHISLWESRAIALMDHPQVWAAVESVSAELEMAGGELERGELITAIKRGMREGLKARNALTSSKKPQNEPGIPLNAVAFASRATNLDAI